ncbi:MAG: SAM-dependent chlorinase/fluorinase [Syntrophobacter sp.]
MAGPIITLLTDFGLQDGYVACMKGVILGIAPEARLTDISHLIAPRDVRSGAFVLSTSYSYFPHGTIHVAVVDPGVGTERRAIAIRTPFQYLIGPDNGIFSFILSRQSGWEARSLSNPEFHLQPVSPTFHGRDIFAPVAAHLARGVPFESLGPRCEPLFCDWGSPVRTETGLDGEIIHIDRFGNAITNVTRNTLENTAPIHQWVVQIAAAPPLPILKTYGHGLPGSALALVGGSGSVEIAVNRGSAALELGLRTGTKVSFTTKDGVSH